MTIVNNFIIGCLVVLLSSLDTLFTAAGTGTTSDDGDDAATATSSSSAGSTTTTTAPHYYEAKHPNCRLFLAESTIPNAGLGIFTGIPLHPGENVAEPDLIVPLQDWDWHSSSSSSSDDDDDDEIDFNFLWINYSWDGREVGMETDMEDATALVIGTGCMPNCNFALSECVGVECMYIPILSMCVCMVCILFSFAFIYVFCHLQTIYSTESRIILIAPCVVCVYSYIYSF